ncbi:hypothetical protein LOTGIDRAFT_84289, partial [Lottia gigantea]
LAAVLSLCSTPVFCDVPTIPGRYILNLDLPPEQRWNDIVPKYKEAVKDMHDLLEDFFEDGLALIDFVASELDQYIPAPYADEMRGISLALNMSLGEVVMSNLLYELQMTCTSIVLEDQKGGIWHSRNFDYAYLGSKLRDITILVDFQRGGQTAYTAATFVGYVGILSGQKPNKFSITVNGKNDEEFLLTLLVALLDNKAKPIGFLTRDTFEKAESFQETVEMLTDTDTLADAYFAVAGIKDQEAVVVTKSRLQLADYWYINTTQGHWYDVQTNYDHGLPEPFGDMNKTRLATEALDKIGRGHIDFDALGSVMSVENVLSHMTVYTVLMNPSQPDLIKLLVRH